MSRDTAPGPESDEEELPEDPHGTLRTTQPSMLGWVFLVGLVIGRLVRPISAAVDGSAPRVGWLPVLALFFLAAILLGVARATHDTLHRQRRRLEPHQAVNRLVLAKACAIAGAALAGGYVGYAVSWLNQDAELAHERLLHSGLAAVAALLTVGASLTLERACRVRGEDSDT